MPKYYLRNPARKLVNCEQSESIDNALRRFKRKVQTEDIITEVKPYSFYLKLDAKRRVNQAIKPCLARKLARKKIRKES
jgi:small subunit ribosomal protein S21